MKRMFLLGAVALALPIYGAEIIVDAEKGQTIQEGVAKATPGDTVIVKPGRYPEIVTFKTSGTEGSPITLKAEKPGTVLIDGSDPVTGWKKVAKPDEVAATANWKKIYYAEVPADKTYKNISLYEDGKLCAIAQDPAPKDPFNFDDSDEFVQVDEATYSESSITDPKYFNQKDANYWKDAFVIVWTANNNMMYRPVWGFHPETGTINYQSVGGYIRPKKDRFSMVNHLDFIRKPGDFVVKKNKAGINTLYYWPYDEKNIAAEKVSFSNRDGGIKTGGYSYITIEGFDLRGHCGPGIASAPGQRASHITVRNNHVYNAQHESWGISLSYVADAVAEGNNVHDIQFGRGIGITGGSTGQFYATNALVINNRISRCGSTGINFYAVHGGKMINNLVFDNNGHHGNGLTGYLGCKDIVMEGNTVLRSNYAITMQQGDNFIIRNNILIGNGVNTWQFVVIASYANNLPNATFENNVILDAKSSFHLAKDMTNYKIKNNILCGLNIWSQQREGEVVSEGNIITLNNDKNRDEQYGKKNTFQTDLSKVFVDAANGDFRRAKGGPLMEAGLLDGGRKVELYPGPWKRAE